MLSPLHSRQAEFQRQTPLKGGPEPTVPVDQVTLSDPADGHSAPEHTHRLAGGLMLGLSVVGMAAGLTGCTSKAPSAPNQGQVQNRSTQLSYAFMSTEDEVELGKQVAARVEKETPLWHNDVAQARLDSIGQKLAGDASRKDIKFTFKLLDTPGINAFAVPGGNVYVTRGLYENYKDDGELTFVVGHEVGHLEERHSVKQLGKATLLDTGIRILTHNKGDAAHAVGGLAEQLIGKQFSQADETQADQLGQGHLRHLGIDPMKAATAMERLQSLTDKGQGNHTAELILSDHPPTQDRIDVLRRGAQAK